MLIEIAAETARCLMAAEMVLSVGLLVGVVTDLLWAELPPPMQPRDAKDRRARENRY
jgi:hypothetical protein